MLLDRLALVVSIALHFLFIWPFFRTQPEAKTSAVQFEIRETSAKAAPGRRGRGRKGGHGPKAGKAIALAPRWTPGPGSAAQQAAQMSGNSDFAEEDWGSHGGNFKEIENAAQYQRLQVELRGMLRYPYRLANRGIQGGVNVRLAFNEHSECDWARSHVGGDNHYLRVYAMALAKKLCTLSAVTAGHFKRNQFIDIGFAFSIDETKLADLDTLHSNVLMFRRSFQKSLLDYQIGPIKGFLFVPAVTLDPDWLFEHWDQYVNGRDPLAEFKDL